MADELMELVHTGVRTMYLNHVRIYKFCVSALVV